MCFICVLAFVYAEDGARGLGLGKSTVFFMGLLALSSHSLIIIVSLQRGALHVYNLNIKSTDLCPEVSIKAINISCLWQAT